MICPWSEEEERTYPPENIETQNAPGFNKKGGEPPTQHGGKRQSRKGNTGTRLRTRMSSRAEREIGRHSAGPTSGEREMKGQGDTLKEGGGFGWGGGGGGWGGGGGGVGTFIAEIEA